jgi:hypothetical protein
LIAEGLIDREQLEEAMARQQTGERQPGDQTSMAETVARDDLGRALIGEVSANV